MKFIDEVRITVQSGNGGPGCVSFLREKYIPRGGPDGGDGGRGGNVILKVAPGRRTLYALRFQKLYRAGNGRSGQGRNCAGRGGDDLIIEVPQGTLVIHADTGEQIKDLVDPDEVFVVAQGGRGGQGNARFKSSTHRTPRFAQPGESGEMLPLRLELRLLADVGIVGLPNAGKSTLVSALSAARPKIADYPFTTLTPSLGVVHVNDREPFVVADIPGLIEGAHAGAGLGTRFLRHVERTRVLLHLVDVSEIDPDHPLAAFETIDRELEQYNPALAQKPRIVVLNKMDVAWAEDAAALFEAAYGKGPQLRISAAAGTGLGPLVRTLCRVLDTLDEPPFQHTNDGDDNDTAPGP